MMPLITLSIVSHADSQKVNQLLNSLQKFEDPKHFQLILTDNLGNDLPEVASAEWCSLHITRNKEQLGFAHNHNKAFKLATGKYFAILNPNLEFQAPIFDSLINTLESQHADLVAQKL